MNIPREFIELLLAKTDLVDVVNSRVPLRKKTGSNFFARCPFHQEKSASFSVSQTKQFYYCFGCGAHGNAIDFLMQHDHHTFKEAIETLAHQVGMAIPTDTKEQTKNDALPALFEFMNQVAEFYYAQMRQSERAIQYLKQRGISGAIAKQFLIGYAPHQWDAVIKNFNKNNQDQKKLISVGLIIHKNDDSCYDRFRDRIMFPIQDYRGRIIGFGGRIIDQGEPKYLNSPETVLFQKGHELYGLYHVLKANRQLHRVLIVEGYMDVVALFQHDITYAVATLGTATTHHHMERLFRYTSEIVFCFDGDAAGRTAASRALQVLFPIMQDKLDIKFLFLPNSEDPDSLIRKEGKIQFETRISQAISLSQFFFNTIIEDSNLTSIEGRARFAANALNHIKKLPSGLFQTILVDELCKRARIEVNEIKNQLKNPKDIEATDIQVVHQVQTTKLPPQVRLMLCLLIQHPKLAQLLPSELPKLELTGYSFLLRLIEILRKDQGIENTGSLLEYFRNQKEAGFIAKLAQIDLLIPDSGLEKELLATINQLQMLAMDQEINHLMLKASTHGLSEIEKNALANWINQKKQGITTDG